MLLPTDDENLNLCLDYFEFRIANPTATMEQIAAHLGYTRQWVYQLVKRWREDGTMDRARLLFAASRHETIQGAIDQVVNRWPEVIMKMLDDALNHENASVRRKASDWLKETVVDGYLASQPKGISEEASYLSSTNDRSFMPTDIPLLVDREMNRVQRRTRIRPVARDAHSAIRPRRARSAFRSVIPS